jgi:hypothetical protein
MADNKPALSDERKKLHADFVAEIRKREISSSENFDKSVLTFSSAGLALSVGFLKDFVPIRQASAAWALYGSWTLFTLSTCMTMGSFLLSMWALRSVDRKAYRYYIECDDAAFDEKDPLNRLTVILNHASGISFVFAMVLTVAFISTNLERAHAMKAGTPTTPDLLQKGLTVPTMQKVPSAPAPAPSQAPAVPPPAAPRQP